MAWKLASLCLLQAISTYRAIQAQQLDATASQTIQWGPCQITGTLPLACGNISVPLDYSKPNSTERLCIELIKASASKKPSKGSIVFNFGGPGASGQELLALLGAQMQATTGGHYDLISFDPRGVGKTLPFLCHETAAQRINFTFLNPYVNGNASDTTVGRLWASSENFATACYSNGKDVGGLIGYAFTARDTMQIVDALGEDGLLRFYGLSAGTPLGATIAAMFPDRIDRMILDGVWNIHEYYHYHAVDGFADTDKTFSGFLSACIAAGGEKCALARLNATVSDVEQKVYTLIEDVKYRPIPYQGMLLDYTIVRNVIFLALATPAQYPDLATFLHSLLTGNIEELDSVFGRLSIGEDPVFSEHRFGIQCGDKPARASTSDDVLLVIGQLWNISKLAGDRITYDVDICSRWKLGANERYLGDFKATTSHPALIIGNTLDPVTPLVSARNASQSLLGSVVLQHDGFGHTSPLQPSLCTAMAIQAYLKDGKLPEPGSICGVDVPLFSNLSWQDVLL